MTTHRCIGCNWTGPKEETREPTRVNWGDDAYPICPKCGDVAPDLDTAATLEAHLDNKWENGT